MVLKDGESLAYELNTFGIDIKTVSPEELKPISSAVL
jgi:hypothetical protein